MREGAPSSARPRGNTRSSRRRESVDRVIRCQTELYLLYGTFMASIRIRGALPVGHYDGGRESVSSSIGGESITSYVRDDNSIAARNDRSQIGADSLTRERRRDCVNRNCNYSVLLTFAAYCA